MASISELKRCKTGNRPEVDDRLFLSSRVIEVCSLEIYWRGSHSTMVNQFVHPGYLLVNM